MKKLFVIASMIVATLSVNAQAEPGSLTIQPRVGGVGALMTSAPDNQFTLSTVPDKDAVAGEVAGVELEYQLAKKLSIAAGVNYQQAGTGWKDVTIRETKYKDMKVETGYVTIPVTANFYLCKGLAIKSGVQFGFLTNAKTSITGEVKNGDVTKKNIVETDIKDQLNKFDLSIPVGISYEFKTPIVIDLRYNIGLSKVGKSESTFKDSRNGALMLTVGYKFKL